MKLFSIEKRFQSELGACDRIIAKDEKMDKVDVEDDEVMQCTPPELKELVESAQVDRLPKKSRTKYEAAYLEFVRFKKTCKTNITSENVVLAYFKEFSKNHAPSSIWNRFSMLKSFIKVKEKVGFEPKQSDVFTKDQIRQFISDAPDSQFLATKVKNVVQNLT